MIGDELAPPGEQPADDAATAVGPPPAGPFQRADEELVKWLRETFREAAEGVASQRPKRKLDWRMYAGDQWEQMDADLAKKQKRPALTLNLLLSIISAVEGEERTNRQEMKFYGEGQEDDAAAFGLNRILKWVMDQCGGEFALSQDFRSMLIAGEGWVVPDVDFFDDPEGKISVLYVDDDEMFDDPLATDPTSADSRYCHRVRYMTEEEGEARWPGFREKVRTNAEEQNLGPETDGTGYRDIYSTPNDTSSPKLYDAKRKMWAVLETWWHQIEQGWVVVDEASGLLVEKTDDEMAALRQEREDLQRSTLQQIMAGEATLAPAGTPPGAVMEAPGMPAMLPAVAMPPALQAKQRPVKRMYQAFTSFDVLLAKQRSPLTGLKRIPYIPTRGLFDKVKGEWFGLIRPLIDTQRQHNVEQSTIVQLMQLMPKASWMGPKGSFHDKVKWQEQIAQPGAMLEYNLSRGKPEPIQSPTIPRHIVDMAFTRPQTMREISGVNIEMTGQRVAADPGVVMEMRQKAAKTVLAPMFDNYRMSKKALGMVLLAYIQTYISPGRRLRVLGPKGAEYVDMTEQMQLGRYDVTVEETNSTVNDRIQTLTVLQTTLPALSKAGVGISPDFIDLLPMEPHIRDSWKRQIAWEMTIAGRLPPEGWQPGMPVPPPPPPDMPGVPAAPSPPPAA